MRRATMISNWFARYWQFCQLKSTFSIPHSGVVCFRRMRCDARFNYFAALLRVTCVFLVPREVTQRRLSARLPFGSGNDAVNEWVDTFHFSLGQLYTQEDFKREIDISVKVIFIFRLWVNSKFPYWRWFVRRSLKFSFVFGRASV